MDLDLRDKITGCFLGVAIGDSLGMPVEGYTAKEIVDKFGRITSYMPANRHKYMGNLTAGSTTDDWQLTKAVAEGIIQNGLDMNAVAVQHIVEYHKSVLGWGSTTREAIGRLAIGEPWTTSGKTNQPGRGTGNGVCMKVSPVGLYMAVTNRNCKSPNWEESVRFLTDLAKLTHWTNMGISSGFAHAGAIFRCFCSHPDSFSVNQFIQAVTGCAMMGQQQLVEPVNNDNLIDRLRLLFNHHQYDNNRIISEMNGSSYVFHSLPFTYMFFVRNPSSIECLYECINSGGDTDSNGSMLASLLGALHGVKIFPQQLIDGLTIKEEVLDLANRFCNVLKL